MTIQRLVFVTKIRSATLATKTNKNQWSSFVFAQMNATNCIGGQNKIRYLYSVFVILYAVRGVKGLIKNFELRIDSIECAGPAVVEGEGLGEGLADDVACLVGKEELRVERDDLDCEGGALGGELRIEGFQMKEDCLFCLEHLFCTLAGNRDENEMFLIFLHMRITLNY